MPIETVKLHSGGVYIPAGRIKRIHVNQHVLASNRRTGAGDPPLTCKLSNENHYGQQIIFFGRDGEEAGRVVYSPGKPLSCGAVLWIETTNAVTVL